MDSPATVKSNGDEARELFKDIREGLDVADEARTEDIEGGRRG